MIHRWAELEVYPNPISSYFEIHSPVTLKTINLYSISGTLLRQYTEQSRYNVNEIPKGVYLLEIVGETERAYLKVVID